MSIINIKYEVSDPAYYDPLIAQQKKRVREAPGDVSQWLELGRLHEAKIDMTNCFARHSFGIRYFVFIYAFFFLMLIIFSIHAIPGLLHLSSSQMAFSLIWVVILTLFFPYLWSLRYPPSGSKYFKKALSIDPECGEAYMYLGLIALRRHQKQEGCRLLEQAVRLGGDNGRIERELKSIYEKEFIAFFHRKNERDIKQQKTTDQQAENIKELRLKISSLEKLNESMTGKIDQAKWEANRERKLLKREMNAQIEDIKEGYEEKIASIEREISNREEEKELAESHFARLTTEIMEAKAELEGMSLSEATRSLEDIMGQHYWQALSEQTRTYLATAEHTLNFLKEDDPDYSLVGMEICKALETEINRTLVYPFLIFLNGNEDGFLKINHIGETRGKPYYFTYLAKVVDKNNFPNMTSLSLGQYHFVLKHTLKGEYALRDYADFLDQFSTPPGSFTGALFLENLETVVIRYRNAIAHKTPMSRAQCEHLRHLVFAGNEALLKSCGRLWMAAHLCGTLDKGNSGALVFSFENGAT